MPEPTTPATQPVLHATGVRVVLGDQEILHGVDIDAHPGEVVALMGGNGSGKSTLVRALVGAIPLSGGSVKVFGGDRDRAAHRRIGYVPQRVTAAAGVAATALEVVVSGLLAGGQLFAPRRATERATAALAEMGVGWLAHRNVATLSGGQQQRVLIARALVRDPKLIFLDEPMAGVDVPTQDALAHTLEEHKKAGAAIVIVLHELGALASVVDRAVVLEGGYVTHVGEPPTALGMHALPGHEHVHAHEGPQPPERAFLELDLEEGA
ncbi:metal ABC transporter ATP-binding protein [Demequina pelophila]|uniref:metal ABC transporter ATP-binding protein n=1 Tax=Demequina pelophila TaxID=1638984 RepID=UPI000781C5AE|nr:ATP-binding cassette domain-containing protein [Demequina pelophila]